MRKLISLIAVPLIFATSCVSEEPIKENYMNKSEILTNIPAFGRGAVLSDKDGDNLVDLIKIGGNYDIVKFYAKGYEKYATHKASKEMTPEIREFASKAFNDLKSLDYEIAKSNYELNKLKQGKNIVDSINLFKPTGNADWDSLKTREQRENFVKEFYKNKK